MSAGRALVLSEIPRRWAERTIREHHYTRTIPSGKSYYVKYEDALIVWSVPANKNIAAFLLGQPGNVWELSRLWAPDGHRPNLLTEAISAAVKIIVAIERPDALVSYADPNAGHSGGVYRAASWIEHGRCEESRAYLSPDGNVVARRAFHSGSTGMTKAQIEARGFKQLKLAGKIRFVKPITSRAKHTLRSAAVVAG
jgi:hypothetical protein